MQCMSEIAYPQNTDDIWSRSINNYRLITAYLLFLGSVGRFLVFFFFFFLM